MRVVKSGKYGGDGWKKNFVCRECGAVIEPSEEDLKVYNSAVAYAGETWDPVVYYTCPECETDNVVTFDVPYPIRDRQFKILEERYK